MNQVENDFFEEFKHVEKICNEMYGVRNGVTQYINEMVNASSTYYRFIPMWEENLRMLKILRDKRNKLAHSEDSYFYNTCTQRDIQWLIDFYQSIMNGTDPLTMLRKRKVEFESSRRRRTASEKKPLYLDSTVKRIEKNVNIERQCVREYQPSESKNYPKKDSPLKVVLVFILCFFIMLVFLCSN